MSKEFREIKEQINNITQADMRVEKSNDKTNEILGGLPESSSC